MAVSGINTNFNNNLAMTLANKWMAPNCINIYSSNIPFFAQLRKRGQIVKGGNAYQWVVPFYYPVTTGPTLQAVSDPYADSVRATETGGISNLQFTPAQFLMNIAVADYDLNAQGSETRRVNYMDTIMEISKTKWVESLNSMLWASESTAGSNGSSRSRLGSLRTYINSGGSSTTDGGATPSRSYTDFGEAAASGGVGGWLSTVAPTGTTLTTIGNVERNGVGGAYFCSNTVTTAKSASVALLNKMITYCTRGGDRPDTILMNSTLYPYYLGIIQSQQRTELKTYGKFEGFTWNGVDVLYDDTVPVGTANSYDGTASQIFVLNTDQISLYYDTMQPQFKPLPDINRPTLNTYTSQQTIQLVIKHPGRLQGRYSNITNP